MEGEGSLPPKARLSFYDQIYLNHLDCADHLGSDESSNVDSTSSTDESDLEMYRNADEYNKSMRALPAEFIRRSKSNVNPFADATSYVSLECMESAFNDPPSEVSVECRYPYNDDEDDSVCSDPFFGYSNEKPSPKTGRGSWANSKFNPMKMYARASRAMSLRRKPPHDHPECEVDEHVGIWTDFTPSSKNGHNGGRWCAGSIEGKDSVNLSLQKRGFYTLFIKNAKAVDTKKQELCTFKIKLKYTIIDCKREKMRIKGTSAGDIKHAASFIVHDPFSEDSISFINTGTISLGNRSIKILLLRAGDDSVLELGIVHHLLDVNPTVLYKLVYSGCYSPMPLSINPHLRLRILSIDSCENLGTTALACLYALEQRISSITGSNAKLGDYFDIICGTGTGAILALCLLKGYSIKELHVQWQTFISGLFKWSHSVAYGLVFDHAHVNQFMRHWIEVLGIDFMCAKPRPLCVVTSTNVKGSNHELFVFRNYTNFHSPYAGTTLAPMWFAGWASNAMPTYMKGPSDTYLRGIGCKVDREAHFVDGQLLCNNPSLVVLQEACELYGFSLRNLIEDNMEVFISLGTANKKNSTSKSRDITPLQILLKNKLLTSTQIVHSHIQQLFAEHPERYKRIEMPRLKGCKCGKTDKKTVDDTFTQALDIVKTYMDTQLERIAQNINL
ncbi:hypothetical protein X943_000333 [Babesia divergens]|uniref:PNPLA domain-containing protein n=1 Tax=Babesia divergens TaxID=32595 RepID=A0AAD9GF24_BABDI|nr:hypothetical protein X943_000333 [Babesia divergens]